MHAGAGVAGGVEPDAERLDHGGAILQVSLAPRPVLEGGREIRHFKKARRRQNVIAKLRRRRHEEISRDAEFERLHRLAAAPRIGVGQDRVRAEIEQRFDRIGLLFEDSVENIVRGAIPRLGGRAERLALAADADRIGFFRQKLLAAHVVHRDLGKIDVAALAVKVADQGVERCDGAAGLGRVGVLTEAVPHVHADRPVVRQQERGLPDFLRRNPVNFFRALRREPCGDFGEPLKNRFA